MENINLPLRHERLYCLEWLKVFAILMVFIFHNTHFFDFIDWSVKNSSESPVMMLIFLLIHFWSMPLFFLLAGAGTKFALDSRSKKEYLLERLKRLLVPFVIGMILLAPPQGYVELLSKTNYDGSFWEYYPQFYKDLSYKFSLDAFGDNTYHLWFLGFLLLFSFIALPFFKCFNANCAKTFIAKIADLCEKKGFLFVFCLPIIFIHLILRVSFSDYGDWADLFYWFTYFLYGYILFSSEKFRHAININYKLALGITLLCLTGLGCLVLCGQGVASFEHPSYSLSSVVFMVLYGILTWSWIVFLLGVGFNLLNFSNKFLKYSGEALLPFYLLHQTIVLLIGYKVVQWEMTIIYKFLIISLLSFFLTVGIYDLFVRRIKIVRVLFGMKIAKSKGLQ